MAAGVHPRQLTYEVRYGQLWARFVGMKWLGYRPGVETFPLLFVS